jgi:DNA-binding protein H-NS
LKVDLSKASKQDLEKLKLDIDEEMMRRAEQDKSSALAAAEKAANEFGFSLAELSAALTPAGKRGAKGKRSKSAPKFRNPENPEQTWSGVGRKPGWIKEAEADGVPLDDLLIG